LILSITKVLSKVFSEGIALLTERIRRTDAVPGVRPQPEDILADAADGGSRAVNQKTIGSLEVGKKADVFVLDRRSSERRMRCRGATGTK
jgi:cytosine/adenosine deaminase-related metal-dependent hydrolase